MVHEIIQKFFDHEILANAVQDAATLLGEDIDAMPVEYPSFRLFFKAFCLILIEKS